jgi:chemotaxis protein MotB
MQRFRHVADEEGDGYFASVSDLMVGILFVFLLMLTVFALNYRQAEQDQLIERSRYERLMAELQQQKLETERQRAEAERQHGEADRRRREAEAEQQRNQQLRGLLKDALDRLEQDIQQHEQARQTLLASLVSSCAIAACRWWSISTRVCCASPAICCLTRAAPR